MLRLSATLVATTSVETRCAGWSVERGVRLSAPASPKIAAPACRPRFKYDEPPCFIDEDWVVPLGAAVVRQFDSRLPTPATDETPGAAQVRLFWRIAAGPARA